MSGIDAVVVGITIFVAVVILILGIVFSARNDYERKHPKLGTPEADAIISARAEAAARGAWHGTAPQQPDLDVPIVAYDRWGNAHVTTRRNQGVAAMLSLILFVVAMVWIYHGGLTHLNCTTTMTTSGSPGNSTTQDVTTCK